MSTHKEMKALILCPDLPYPIAAGGQMRMASLCEALSTCCTVHMACVAPELPPETRSWSDRLNMTIEHFHGKPPGILSRRIRRCLMMLTMSNLRHEREEQLFFDRVYRRLQPDLVWLETPYLLRYALTWMIETPLVVDYWGTSEGAKRLFLHATGFRKAVEWLKWRTALGGEIRYARSLRDIVCVSSLDGNHFRALAPQCRIWPIPIGIVKPPTAGNDLPLSKDDLSLIFTGDLSYAPNIDAALFFANSIFPLIKKKLPGARFRIVGRNPDPAVLELQRISGIHVEGYVPDLSEEIRRASVYVLPMRLGSGIRSKLFDVFPLGKAIVTTTIGAEGLELQHDRNCLIADGAEDFARCCIQLLTDEMKKDLLGGEARRLATDVYTQENINRMVRSVVETIARDERKHRGPVSSCL
jgi:glycosyltransferase involved in cell wall biosynthesis